MDVLLHQLSVALSKMYSPKGANCVCVVYSSRRRERNKNKCMFVYRICREEELSGIKYASELHGQSWSDLF